MSATNRGSKRNESDFYATPFDAVYSLLRHIDIPDDAVILESGAGNGNIIKALRDRDYSNHIDAVELRESERVNLELWADNVYIGDYLTMDGLNTYDLIIGNPPYSLAREFIDKSLQLLKPGGRLIYLLRTNFLESNKRFKWWQDKLPSGLYTLHKRPSFTGKGTDATSYSWFIWTNGEIDKQTILVI